VPPVFFFKSPLIYFLVFLIPQKKQTRGAADRGLSFFYQSRACKCLFILKKTRKAPGCLRSLSTRLDRHTIRPPVWARIIRILLVCWGHRQSPGLARTWEVLRYCTWCGGPCALCFAVSMVSKQRQRPVNALFGVVSIGTSKAQCQKRSLMLMCVSARTAAMQMHSPPSTDHKWPAGLRGRLGNSNASYRSRIEPSTDHKWPAGSFGQFECKL
jgi:hypothetical protein